MKKNYLVMMLIGAILIAMVTVFGCDSKGPAEKAGEKIDQSVESAKDVVEEAGDKITGKGPAEKMGENVDDAVDDVKKSAESGN